MRTNNNPYQGISKTVKKSSNKPVSKRIEVDDNTLVLLPEHYEHPAFKEFLKEHPELSFELVEVPEELYETVETEYQKVLK
jgi:hypothetical protein